MTDKKFLEYILNYKAKHQGYRFGQDLADALEESGYEREDLFTITDKQLVKAITKYRKSIGG